MRRAIELSRKMLSNGIPVILEGEPGTGRVSVAQTLHDQVQHSGRPATLIDCAIVDRETLIDEVSQFLGISQNVANETADPMAHHSNTLILRELGSLPVDLQAAPLSLLARLGAMSSGPSTGRNIPSTTSMDLEVLSTREALRSDLLHVLKGAALSLPSLHERTDLEKVIGDCLRGLSDHPVALSNEARAALLNYHWPGNLPELHNALRFGLVCCADDRIEADDLP